MSKLDNTGLTTKLIASEQHLTLKPILVKKRIRSFKNHISFKGLRHLTNCFMSRNNMNLIKFFIPVISYLLATNPAVAGVYKCTDSQGNTSYQSTPCALENKAIEIDVKTGRSTDISLELKQKERELALKKQQEAALQQQLKLEEKRKQDALEQSQINQTLIKNNPIQYSAFAIPPYLADNLTGLVKKYQTRLPEIEKFRRLAAQKALSTGECTRVESDELSIKSKHDQLVFSIDCSSAKTFYFNESELIN